MNSKTPTPRRSDVARWVATLATPLPSMFMRDDYRRAKREQDAARSQLRSYGLNDFGQAPISNADMDHAAQVEREIAAERVAR